MPHQGCRDGRATRLICLHPWTPTWAIPATPHLCQVALVALRLTSPQLKTPVTLDLSNPAKLAELKVTIKEVGSRVSEYQRAHYGFGGPGC